MAAPHQAGVPGTSVVVGIPLAQRYQEAAAQNHLRAGYSEGAVTVGISYLDDNPHMPMKRAYRDLPFACCFCLTFAVLVWVMAAFAHEVPGLLVRKGTTWNVNPDFLCGSSADSLTTWPTDESTQVAGIAQRLSNPATANVSGRRLSPIEFGEMLEGAGKESATQSAAGSADEDWEMITHVELGQQAEHLVDLPGLSALTSKLQLLSHASQIFSQSAIFESESEAEIPRGRRTRSSSNQTQAQENPDMDCERACSTFQECTGFQVTLSGGTTTCTYYTGNLTLGQAAVSSSCWVKDSSVKLNKESDKFIGIVFASTMVGSIISMLAAMCFVKFASVNPTAATYAGVFCVPACMILVGVVLLAVLFPLVGGAALLIGLVLVCMGTCCMSCMCFCYRSLLPLTIEVVDVTSKVVVQHWSMFGISVCGSILSLLWCFVLGIAFLGVYGWEDRSNALIPQSQQAASGSVSYAAYFLFFVVYFWGGYTAFNTCHTAFCGVFGRWYFGLNDGKEVRQSLKVACTTSFGSVCLGSLIIAVVRALEQVLNMLKRDAAEDGNMVLMIIACFLECIISCIGDIIEWISTYAYVQVAIRGLSFWQASKATYAVATVSNLVYVVSAMLVQSVVFLGSVLCALIGAAAAAGFGYATCGVPGFCLTLSVICGVLGCVGGLLAGGNAVGTLNSGAASILMCWAERPDVLAQTNPKIAEKFEEATRKAWES